MIITKHDDPFNFGASFKLEKLSHFNPYFEKTTLIATPILKAESVMESTLKPLISYFKIKLDPSIHKLSISIYSTTTLAHQISIGYEKQSRKDNLLKRIITKDSELTDLFCIQFLSYFKDKQDLILIKKMIESYDLLKIEEVPCFCQTGISLIVLWRDTLKLFNQLNLSYRQ